MLSCIYELSITPVTNVVFGVFVAYIPDRLGRLFTGIAFGVFVQVQIIVVVVIAKVLIAWCR